MLQVQLPDKIMIYQLCEQADGPDFRHYKVTVGSSAVHSLVFMLLISNVLRTKFLEGLNAIFLLSVLYI